MDRVCPFGGYPPRDTTLQIGLLHTVRLPERLWETSPSAGTEPSLLCAFLVCGMGRGLSSTRAAAGRALTPTSGDSAIDALVAIKPVWPRSLQIKYTILRTVADADQIHPRHADEVVRRQQPGCKIAIDAEWAEMIGKILDAVSAETPFKFVAAAPGETADLLATQTCFAAHGPQAEVRSPIYHNLNRMQFDAREDLPGLLQEQIDSPLRGVNLLQFDPQKFRAGPGGPGSEAWWGIQHEVLHTLGPLDLGAVDFIARNLDHDTTTDLTTLRKDPRWGKYR